ncbi:MAG: hypothetical protein ABSG10_13710, partial [Terracidiphilus sp.]
MLRISYAIARRIVPEVLPKDRRTGGSTLPGPDNQQIVETLPPGVKAAPNGNREAALLASASRHLHPPFFV